MSRLIDADALLNELDKLDLDYGAMGGVAECIDIIDNAPTIEPSGDLISREETIKMVQNIVIDKEVIEAIKALPSADRPTLKQTDTMIIADALRYLVKDTERHELDRTRAEELREQSLQYGASMCSSADRPIIEHDKEWIIGCIKHDGFIKTDRFDKANNIIVDALESCDRPKGEWLYLENEPYSKCSVCGAYIDDLDDEKFNYCPHCGADMQLDK